jgi:hypothetical protein
MAARKVIASVLTKVLDFEEPSVPKQDDRCEHCGRSPGSTQRTIGELAAITLCGCLLLTVLTIAATVAYRWIDGIDREGRRLFDRPAWHEPLDDWSL